MNRCSGIALMFARNNTGTTVTKVRNQQKHNF
jgi:hypothetical protein